MLTNLICLAAKGVIRDANTNTVSVFSILEEVGPSGFPAFIQEVAVLAVWQRERSDAATHEFQLVVRNNQQELMKGAVSATFGEATVNRSIVNLQGLVLQEPGELSFSFMLKKKTLARYTVKVKAPEPTAVSSKPKKAAKKKAASKKTKKTAKS
jgi:hypothetical protein